GGGSTGGRVASATGGGAGPGPGRGGRDRGARAPAGSPPAPPPSSRVRAARAVHPPSPPPLRGARFAHQRRKGRVERPPRPLAALSPSPRSQAYPLAALAPSPRLRGAPLCPRAALAPSPRLRGEGGGEGLAEMTQLVQSPPHPTRSARRPLPARGERATPRPPPSPHLLSPLPRALA